MNEDLLSAIATYLVSGFLRKKARPEATRMMIRRTRANTALKMKNKTETTPIRRPGPLNTSVMMKRKRALMKFIAQMEMDIAFVCLSIQGLMTEAATRAAASM